MRIIRKNRHEEASVLMISIIAALIIGFMLGSYLILIHSQNLSVARSQSWNTALAVAEAGVEEALAQLNPGVSGISNAPPRKAGNGWVLSGGFYSRTNQQNVLNGYYGVKFTDASNPTIYSTGYTRAPISGQLIARVVEVQTTPSRLFPVGLAARMSIDLKGNNISIDSYDSSMTNLFPGGMYSVANRRDHGDVASAAFQNSSSVSIGNANIRGKVRTGTGTTPTIGPNGSLGDNAWVGAATTGVKPGWWSDDFNREFPDVLPPYTSGAAMSSGTSGGTNYTYLLGSANYYVGGNFSVANNQTFCVAPGENAVLYVTGNLDFNNGSLIYVAPNATLRIYVAGDHANFDEINVTGNANCFQYYGLPSNTAVTWGGNDNYVGTVYAPNADYTLGGGGNNTYDYQGAAVIKSINMNGHFNVHYDEDLARRGPPGPLVVAAWREL